MDSRQLLTPVAAFEYVTAPNAPTYRAIVDVFASAKQRYCIELRPADVAEALSEYRIELEGENGLDYHLGKLCEWGNLSRRHDGAAVQRVSEFYRSRFVYTLTAVGEAAHRAIAEVEATVGKSGSLQLGMLKRIRDSVRSLAELSHSPDPQGEDVHSALHELDTAFDVLTREATQFLGELHRHIEAERVDEQVFVAQKRALLNYISRFVEQLRTLRDDISASIAAIDPHAFERVVDVAADAAELPPALDGVDPRGRWIADRRAKWDGVTSWFVGDTHDEVSTVERLRREAARAIVRLMRRLQRLNEQRVRRVDRSADFRTLARWFEACHDDEAAHRLWQQAFGLYSARHFHLDEEDVETTSAATSWWNADPVTVPVPLRTKGRISKAGRPSPAPDRSGQKQWIAEVMRKQRAEDERALRRFVGCSVRLRDVGKFERAEFSLLLKLLNEVLNRSGREAGLLEGRTADGAFDIALKVPEDGGDLVEIETPDGRLRCRDYEIRVTEAGAVRRKEGVA